PQRGGKAFSLSPWPSGGPRRDRPIEEGQFVCILGPSACGKSTLFTIIAGPERPSRGEVPSKAGRWRGPGRTASPSSKSRRFFPD
ncbi:MAG: ATP-binding cassette domain-containing protein, partial [Firmicutes bacterium]|nr:ATP-binding cassette domain-containing protein [Bacillota bacterium]